MKKRSWSFYSLLAILWILVDVLMDHHNCHLLVLVRGYYSLALPSFGGRTHGQRIISFNSDVTTKRIRILSCLHMQSDEYSSSPQQPQQPQQQLHPIIHHTAIKTRNITLAMQFYSLLGFEPTVRFRAGPARAVWLEQQRSQSQQQQQRQRLELLEVPSFLLQEPPGQKRRAMNLFQRSELLGHHHLALDVTALIQENNATNTTTNTTTTNTTTTPTTNKSLQTWLNQLNDISLQTFGKTLNIALSPEQQLIGNMVYELAFLYDADGALVELLHQQTELPQSMDSGWEPWDGTGFIGGGGGSSVLDDVVVVAEEEEERMTKENDDSTNDG